LLHLVVGASVLGLGLGMNFGRDTYDWKTEYAFLCLLLPWAMLLLRRRPAWEVLSIVAAPWLAHLALPWEWEGSGVPPDRWWRLGCLAFVILVQFLDERRWIREGQKAPNS
jgi:hypothetical protein